MGWVLGKQPSEGQDCRGQAVPAPMASVLLHPGLWRHHPHFTYEEAEAQGHPENKPQYQLCMSHLCPIPLVL